MGRRAEAVDSRLHNGVGKREHGTLDAGGNADAQNAGQLRAGDAQLAQVQAEGAFLAHEERHHDDGAQGSGDDGGDADARGAPTEQAHEGEVEHEVHHNGGSEGIQRSFRIAVGPQ